jgi:quercetin dioxygenase-like cupin family protein
LFTDRQSGVANQTDKIRLAGEQSNDLFLTQADFTKTMLSLRSRAELLDPHRDACLDPAEGARFAPGFLASPDFTDIHRSSFATKVTWGLHAFCGLLDMFCAGQRVLPELYQSTVSLTCIKAPGARACDTGHMTEKPLIDPAKEKVVSLAEETKFAPNGIVSRTLLRTETTRVVLFGFAEGQEVTEHTSTQQAIIQILSGTCEFSLAGQPRSLKSGDLLYMPPNLRHAVKATSSFSMLLTLTKSAEKFAITALPERKDELQPV